MKKQLFIAAIVLSAACMMQSCIIGAVGKLKKASEETTEILNGKIFQISKATVHYSDGVIFAFKENGKYQYIEDDYEITIYTPNSIITCDKDSKEYSIYETDFEGLFGSEYCFPEELLRVEKIADKYDPDINFVESTRPVAGKTCVCFSDGEAVIAGWKRILMYSKDDYEMFEAESIVETADDKLFQIPAGYNPIDDSED